MALFRQKPKSVRLSLKALGNLQESLWHEHAEISDYQKQYASDPVHIELLNGISLKLAKLMNCNKKYLAAINEKNLWKIYRNLNNHSMAVTEILLKEPQEHYFCRMKMSNIIDQFLIAEKKLFKVIEESGIEEEIVDSSPIIEIHSDSLYQAYYNLFPAEKMLVLSGREDKKGKSLGAAFDVTGKANVGHVQADPKKLANALISMTLTETHLAAWFHSHPGKGKVSTNPSSIDIEQYNDWLQDYSNNLVSAIFVNDRWVRFWGENLCNGNYRLRIVGNGVTKDNEHEHVYRLANGS